MSSTQRIDWKRNANNTNTHKYTICTRARTQAKRSGDDHNGCAPRAVLDGRLGVSGGLIEGLLLVLAAPKTDSRAHWIVLRRPTRGAVSDDLRPALPISSAACAAVDASWRKALAIVSAAQPKPQLLLQHSVTSWIVPIPCEPPKTLKEMA